MSDTDPARPRRGWLPFLQSRSASDQSSATDDKADKEKWSMGILNDKKTIEVPGSVLLLASDRNEPLGLRNAPARTSASSIPISITHVAPQQPAEDPKKKTPDGKIILDPQPDDSANDPLNWPSWRRDLSLISLGLYCMLGGGMTTILAAGFTDVASDYQIDVSQVSLTVGLYMMGLGLGCVIFSPTAILYGKRPVYLFSSVIFLVSAVWCALSPNFISLILGRIFQGIAVSPVECLPSATIAEIFFLHERAYRIGIYTLLLLGGKNLVPLVSAAIIQRLGWRWTFWMVAIIVGFCGILLFLFVPETFWDRTPVRKSKKPASRPNFFRRLSSRYDAAPVPVPPPVHVSDPIGEDHEAPASPQPQRAHRAVHIGFAPDVDNTDLDHRPDLEQDASEKVDAQTAAEQAASDSSNLQANGALPVYEASPPPAGSHAATGDNNQEDATKVMDTGSDQPITSPAPDPIIAERTPSESNIPPQNNTTQSATPVNSESLTPRQKFGELVSGGDTDSERQSVSPSLVPGGLGYTAALREQPAKSFVQQLRPFHGRLHRDKWWKVALRPLILFMYPAVLWSSVVYSCSVGWLIVISESVAVIYRAPDSYNFSALQTGLIYISPFVGGILGTAVAGKVSDVVVKRMARRNGGLYEPEFRLVMAAPIALSTVIGLMGFGWSAEERDNWIVPTVFLGVVSFGCLLGSTTSITFCVDSYRQYAGEALVTLNFSKNIFHGLVFSLFVTGWIDSDGPKIVFIWIGIIQLILLLFTIPMYIYGKRARMWTVRKNFMEKL